MKTMIEWHTLATHEWKRGTWFRGRFLEEWAEPNVTSELHEAFARFDRENIRRALMASANLFSRIACETAGKLIYCYSMESDRKAAEWMEECLAEKDKTRH